MANFDKQYYVGVSALEKIIARKKEVKKHMRQEKEISAWWVWAYWQSFGASKSHIEEEAQSGAFDQEICSNGASYLSKKGSAPKEVSTRHLLDARLRWGESMMLVKGWEAKYDYIQID